MFVASLFGVEYEVSLMGDSYSFGSVSVDLRTYTVSRFGFPLPLEPKAFDLLVYLIQNRERVVSKEELLQAVWGGVAVTSAVVAQCIFVLRRTLGDNVLNQGIVRTVNRRGYQFVGALDQFQETSEVLRSRERAGDAEGTS
jgi:DNA-binding winged helix-turn-helix (wHTH) protein